jgi:hypothetical protein
MIKNRLSGIDWSAAEASRFHVYQRLELGGDALELSQVSAADQARLIDLFVSRHVIGESGQ